MACFKLCAPNDPNKTHDTRQPKWTSKMDKDGQDSIIESLAQGVPYSAMQNKLTVDINEGVQGRMGAAILSGDTLEAGDKERSSNAVKYHEGTLMYEMLGTKMAENKNQAQMITSLGHGFLDATNARYNMVMKLMQKDNELTDEMNAHHNTKVELTQKDNELTVEKKVHHNTKVELKKKEKELKAEKKAHTITKRAKTLAEKRATQLMIAATKAQSASKMAMAAAKALVPVASNVDASINLLSPANVPGSDSDEDM